jgi:hypothetical protein
MIPVTAEDRAVPWDSRVGIKPIARARHQHVKVGSGPPADFIEEFVRTFDSRDAGRRVPDGAPSRTESMSEGIAPRLVPILAKNRHEERLAGIGRKLYFERRAICLNTRGQRPEP